MKISYDEYIISSFRSIRCVETSVNIGEERKGALGLKIPTRTNPSFPRGSLTDRLERLKFLYRHRGKKASPLFPGSRFE